MRSPRTILVASVIAATLATAYAAQPPQQPSDSSPVLTPEAALKTFAMPPGYRLELVASEPLIQDPVVIDWDPEGRMWAVEMPGYMLDIQATRELDPIGRVVVFEDTNADGRLDKRTVFADRLVLPRALKVLDRGVLVGEPPNLWLMKDTNGDLKMDSKELVTDKYGRREANVEHNANSLLWALDNWIYTSEVDTFLRLKSGKFEVVKTLARGQWGASQDDAGRVYRNSNASALHVDLVPSQYYARNPTIPRTRGSFEFLGGPGDDLNATWPAHATPGVNRGYQTGVLRDDGRLASFTAVAAPTVYRGDRLPSELYGNVFLVEPSANLVSRVIVTDNGSTLRGRKAYERSEFITSTDERFRPVYLSSAPDGTLYVVDMYRGIIQHKGYITEYLRDQILARQLEQPTARGRIYRVVHETTRRDRTPALASMPPARLVAMLAHPNGWWRDTAQRLLVERNDASVAVPLQALASTAPEARTRLHALWTLDGMDASDAATVTRALGDPSRDVRVAAIRLSERWLREPNHSISPVVLKLASDADWSVRQQLAASLGVMPRGEKESALTSLLESHANDPVVMDAAVSGLQGSEAAVLDKLMTGKDTPQRTTAITMLAAAIVAGGEDAAVQSLFERAADGARPAWQRSAVLRGAEVSLLGAVAPGSPSGRGRGRGGAPSDGSDPMAPGARGGRGGAPAFPSGNRAQAGLEGENGGGGRAAGRGGRGRGGARPTLKLTREPALVALAARSTGDLSTRAASVLARVEWPGKPGVAVAAPLSPAELARFDAGREVYQNLCVACHQPNGRGLEKVAPTLIGSEFALGSPQIPVRILLNGKEGPVGLMPPLGSVLSDEQIAAVLTYIRREWGNTGAPIDGRDVGQIRPLTSGRTRPWTDAELAALGGGR
jgi:mono/diheme cytochrome c family protein